jgi:mono/diheme cytochrome c family protein
MSRDTLIKIASLILMVVSFVAYIAGASAFPVASENLLPWSVWFLISVIVNIVLWSNVMKLLTFSLAVIWFYAFVAGLVPESSTAVNLTSLDWSDPDAVAEQGALVFNGKGQCAACHTVDPSAPPGRCPDLTDIGINAASRVPGTDAKTYLIESLYEPHKYLVPGYGKIMPEIWKAPIALSKLEIEAVIAYLQSLGGEIDPTPFDEPIDRADAGTIAEALPPLLTGDPELGKKVFVTAACISCHAVTGIESPAAGETTDFEVVTAPDLSEIAAFNDMRYLEESILLPGAQIVSGYGAVIVRANGTTYQGTLVSQDTEQIVVRTKTADGVEEEHTLLLSELDNEPIEELSNLQARGYFTLTLTPTDSDAPVSGEIVSETDDTVTLKIGGEDRSFSKTDVKSRMTVITFDGDEIVGDYVSGLMDDDEIVLIVDGSEEIFDTFDLEEATFTRASGKKLLVTSPMPENFPLLLSVSDMSNLLSFLSTLTGATAEAAPAETDDASAE